MGYWSDEVTHRVTFLGFSITWSGRMSVTRWLFMAGLVVLAGFGMLAVMALVITWAVKDMLANGVTWLPVFAVLVCLGLMFSNNSD